MAGIDSHVLCILAWDFCLQKLNFVKFSNQQQLFLLSTLYYLHKLHDDSSQTLKSLLRIRKQPLEGSVKWLLLLEAIRQNDEELSHLCLLDCDSQHDFAAGLIFAVKQGKSKMIEYFLAKEAEVNLDWVRGEPRSSLQIACDNGDIPLIDLLLKYDPWRRTILHVAARFGSYHIVESLQTSQEIARLQEARDKSGSLPIHYAVYQADVQMVQLLASLGCPNDIRDMDGYNLLHIAVTRDMQTAQREEAYKDLVKWLIAENYDQSALNNDGETPLQCAIEQGAPQWALDILQTDGVEPVHTGVYAAVVEGESANPIVITDDEEDMHFPY
ncbi:hypothetical protein N7494_013171 [Penicillium frequentans]|uniref:Uncharacterized protein n=1 Tax=Penicillium frequentans TaxID=3151616 RepID=A0AAD6G9K9_9EURO|nr:hypothetical protein N7494_013171 [Penicillium glabrum]